MKSQSAKHKNNSINKQNPLPLLKSGDTEIEEVKMTMKKLT